MSTKASNEIESKSIMFGQEYWLGLFAGSEEAAKNYLISVCKAIISKDNAKVGVKLAEGMDAEELIMATKAALPVWLQKKFAAVSKWKGFMDGSASAPIDGMQLVCYQEGEPTARHHCYPVFDFSNQGRGKNVEIPQALELEEVLVDWIWQTLEVPEQRDSFETFMETEFGSICDVLSFEEQAVCYCFSTAFRKNSAEGLQSEDHYEMVSNFKPETAKGMLFFIHSYFAADFQDLLVLQRLARKCCDLLLSAERMEPTTEEPTQSAETTDILLWLIESTDQESASKARKVLTVLWNTYRENGQFDLLEDVANTFLDNLEDLFSKDVLGTAEDGDKATNLIETIREVLRLLPGNEVSH
ncbi:MAG: hypothetical protein LBM69_05655, partial [Lachnospiraceae bacterium]|nr:hypothetical protein [Lachnospiraceae bacterium]